MLQSQGAYVGGKAIICGDLGSYDCYTYSFEDSEWTKDVTLDSERRLAASLLIDEETWWLVGGLKELGPVYHTSTLVYKVRLDILIILRIGKILPTLS